MFKHRRSSQPEDNSGEVQSKTQKLKSAEDMNNTSLKNGQARNQGSSLPRSAFPGALILARIFLSAILIVLSLTLNVSDTVNIVFLLAAAAISGYDLVLEAARDMQNRKFWGESLPMLLAVILCFLIHRGLEGAASLIILQIAYIVRGYAISQTKRQLLATVGIDEILKASGNDKAFVNIRVGDSVLLSPGSIAPSDCVITDGEGSFDLSFITGDCSPVVLSCGQAVYGGCKCLDGKAMAEICVLPEKSLAVKISGKIENGCEDTTKVQSKITDIAKYFVPALLVIGIAVLIVLPLKFDVGFDETLRRVITILALASPCAVLLSIPLTFLSGMILARKNGFVISNSSVFENTAVIGAVAFDKEGAITGNSYTVSEIRSDKMDSGTFLKVAAFASFDSADPLYLAISTAYGDNVDSSDAKDRIEYPGKGISVTIDGIQILLGGETFLAQNQVSVPETNFDGRAVYMSVNGLYAGCIVLNQSLNSQVYDTIRGLSKAGIDRISMLSGDIPERDRPVASKLNISEYYAECSPDDKAKTLLDIKKKISEKNTLAYVSANIDSKKPFAAADVGIMLTPARLRADCADADISVLSGSVAALPKVIALARNTLRCLTLKMLIGFAVKLILTVLAIFGIAPLWFALVIDNCFSLALIISSLGRVHFESKKTANEISQ